MWFSASDARTSSGEWFVIPLVRIEAGREGVSQPNSADGPARPIALLDGAGATDEQREPQRSEEQEPVGPPEARQHRDRLHQPVRRREQERAGVDVDAAGGPPAEREECQG